MYRGSSAQIFSNTIQNNGSHGVFVDRNAQAEIGACIITGNAGDGILGMRNAGLDIGTDATGATPNFDDDTNTGTNGGFGVRCLFHLVIVVICSERNQEIQFFHICPVCAIISLHW